MIVVDASVLVDILLQNPAATTAEHRLFDSGETLHAPHLIDAEVLHALRRHALTEQFTSFRVQAMLNGLNAFSIDRYPHGGLMQRAWTLRANISAYDALYVALAEALDATLLTRDHRLANAPGHNARIELV